MSGSFESAMTLARMIMAEGDMPLLDRLQDAHDHELEQLRKSRFHEGYMAGQHSMDAEHYAVALRLRALPLDGDTQENLSQIARAVWHSDFGWTQGACKALRDELVRLMGGVTYQSPIVNCGNPYGPGDAVLDAGIITPYDVLGNERHKAVCKLRNTSLETGSAIKNLAHALGVKWNPDNAPKSMGLLRDRLIHLLGEDECNFSGVESYMDATGEKGNPAETSDASTDHVSFDTPLPEDGTNPNDATTSSITAELHECVETASKRHDHCISEAELLEIADRMDEQAKALERECDAYKSLAKANERWCDNLLELLRDARDEYKMLDRVSAETSVNFHAMRDRVWGLEAERDELQEKLDEMREHRDHWASEATKMYRLFFPHEEYCMPNEPSDMVAHKINELRAKLDDAEFAIANWRERGKSFDASERLREELRMERDELRERLDRVADALRGVERGTMCAWEAADEVGRSSTPRLKPGA